MLLTHLYNQKVGGKLMGDNVLLQHLLSDNNGNRTISECPHLSKDTGKMYHCLTEKEIKSQIQLFVFRTLLESIRFH